MRKLIVIVFVIVIVTLPFRVFGQTAVGEPIQKSISLPVTTTKPISSTSPQSTPITKPTNPQLIDESYCHGFDYKSCLSSRCQLYSSCPVCLDIGTCHAKDYHKWTSKKYEPPLYSETKTRKIEVQPTDGTKKIEITDDKGVTKTVESEQLNEVIISPNPEKCQPKPCIVLTLKVEDGKTKISSGGIIAQTTLPVKIEEDKITMTTKNQTTVEILNPTKVKEKIESYAKAQPNTLTVTSINLNDCNLQKVSGVSCNETTGVYKVDVVRENKLLGLLPIKSSISYTLNASTGDMMFEQSPWYLKVFPFLFK